MSISDGLPLEISSQVFLMLQANNENCRCVDCNSQSTAMASINHGIVLCIYCAQSHNRLGEDISKIKSLKDVWTLNELKMMTAGGNSAFKEFFSFYKLVEAPLDFKYKTKAAYFYRDVLSLLADDGNYEGNYPSIEEGLETFEEIDLGETTHDATAPDDIEANKKWHWLTNIYKKYPKIKRKSLETIDKGVQKIKEFAKVDSIMFSAKKRIEGLTVTNVKIESQKFIKDIESYITLTGSIAGNYLNMLNSCSNPERSYETDMRYD